MVDEPESVLLLEEAAKRFSSSCSSYRALDILDKRQRGGRWYPVFSTSSNEKQEAYIEKWVERDRELGYY